VPIEQEWPLSMALPTKWQILLMRMGYLAVALLRDLTVLAGNAVKADTFY
jgi:hypothetical protein